MILAATDDDRRPISTTTSKDAVVRSARRRRRPNDDRGRRMRAAQQFPLALLLLISDHRRRRCQATTNFCGTNWSAASSTCADRQPCPSGTDEECTSGGTCWADTTCDTSLGHGILYDRGHPTHSRFCGTGWSDAVDGCSLERHCPSGDDEECKDGESCYSFLSCNYVDMIGGPGNGGGSGSGGGGGSNGGGGSKRLPDDDPSRNNFCGRDWNSALASCDLDDHWCPSGSDGDCPDGKTCFAGTECKYVSDLIPTSSPTFGPSDDPTPSPPTDEPTPMPVVYNRIENTRFCGAGWEDARNTCRIDSWCPSGDDAHCPDGTTCYGWITGCNIVDFYSYANENGGGQIFGAEGWLLTEEEVAQRFEDDDDGSVGGVVDGGGGPGMAPAEILESLSAPQQGTTAVVLYTNPPTRPPSTSPPTAYDPHRFVAANHVFCGRDWNDANTRCSPQTFCSGGATVHECGNVGEYCWAGVTGCDAADWRPTQMPTWAPTAMRTEAPSARPTTREPTTPPLTRKPTPPMAPAMGQTTSVAQKGDTSVVETMVIRQSYCAENYDHLMSSCATLRTCNRYRPCPGEYRCFSNVKCVVPVVANDPSDEQQRPAVDPPAGDNDELASLIAEVEADRTPEPTTYAPTASPPAIDTYHPTYRLPTYHPTSFALSDEEVAQRLTNMNDYCASSLAEVMSSCGHALRTCNPGENTMCGPGTSCFENIVCPDEYGATAADAIAAATRSPIASISRRPTSMPTRAATNPPVAASTTNNDDGSAEGTNDDNYVQGGNDRNEDAHDEDAAEDGSAVSRNYCARSRDLLESTCSTAPTCNDGDGPCPTGHFCFPDTVCGSGGTGGGDDDDGEMTPPPVAVVVVVAPEPVSPPAIILESGGNGNPAVAAVAQNYCGESEDKLSTACATARTCNDGDGPCPPGLYCFGNISCPIVVGTGESSPPAADATMESAAPTARPTTTTAKKPVPSDDNGAATGGKQNYCARSASDLAATCARAPTCNVGDGPCPVDTYCFPRVACDARPQQQQLSADDALLPARPPPESMPAPPPKDPEPNNDAAAVAAAAQSTAADIDPGCDGLCLRPIDPSNCAYVPRGENGIDVPPCTGASSAPAGVDVGYLCTATGRCGTDLHLDNCPDYKDVYVVLPEATCYELGFPGGSGVVPALEGEGGVGDGEDEAGDGVGQFDDSSSGIPHGSIGAEDDETSREASSGTTDHSNPEYETFDGEFVRGDTFGGWWKKENGVNRSAPPGGRVSGWKSRFVALAALSLVIHSLAW